MTINPMPVAPVASGSDAPVCFDRRSIVLAGLSLIGLSACGGGSGTTPDPLPTLEGLVWDGNQGWDQRDWS